MSETIVGKLLSKMESTEKREAAHQWEDWTYLLEKNYKNQKYTLAWPKTNYAVASVNGKVVGEFDQVKADGFVISTR